MCTQAGFECGLCHGTAGAAGSRTAACEQCLGAGRQPRAAGLTVAERAVLPALIKARLALSLVNGAWTVEQQPGADAAYVLLTQAPGWRLLLRLAGVSATEVLRRLQPVSKLRN